MILRKWLLLVCIVMVTGCAYTRGHQLPTILTSSEQRWIIPKGTPFKAIQSSKDALTEYVSKEDDLVVLNKGNLQEMVEAANAKAIGASRVQKERMMWGGAVTSLAGVLGTVLWRSRKKMKFEGNVKAEA